MLTAVGIDADDSLYPIAFAVAQKENTVTWKWFLGALKNSLDLECGDRITIMSDMQKVCFYASFFYVNYFVVFIFISSTSIILCRDWLML